MFARVLAEMPDVAELDDVDDLLAIAGAALECAHEAIRDRPGMALVAQRIAYAEDSTRVARCHLDAQDAA